MCYKTDGEKENRGPDGDVQIEGNSGSDGKGERSEMVRACVEGDDGHVLRKALKFEVRDKRKPARPKIWKMQVEKESKSVGSEIRDAMNRVRRRVGVREIAAGVNPTTPVYGDKPGSNLDDDDDDIQGALAE